MMTKTSDEIGAELRRIVGLVDGVEPTPEQAGKVRTIGNLSIALIEHACSQGKAVGLTPEEVCAAYRFGLLSLEQATTVVATAARFREHSEGDDE